MTPRRGIAKRLVEPRARRQIRWSLALPGSVPRCSFEPQSKSRQQAAHVSVIQKSGVPVVHIYVPVAE
jgi:hypothetical protein